MRHSGKILAAVVALSLLTGCTSFQAKEARRSVVHGFFGMVMDVATGESKRRKKERKRCLDNPANRWGGCPSSWHANYDRPTQAEREEEARLKSLREDAHYKAEADEIMQALDDAKQRSGRPPVDIPTRDYEREGFEREERRKEALNNQAEFDEFMEELETAEQPPDDPPLESTFSE